MGREERELLELARAGDAQALERLLAKHEKQVYRFGLRMCGSEDAAREVLQETLLAAFKHIHSFRGEARLSTWLYQLARSFCLRSRRTRVGEPTELARGLRGVGHRRGGVRAHRGAPGSVREVRGGV